MGLPTIQRTWTIVPNIRIKTNDGVVLPGITGSMQKYLYTWKQVMVLSGGYTLKGSAANGTGAMDGVDRWPTPQAIVAGSAGGNALAYNSGVLGDVAWMCLTDKGGTDVTVAWMAPVTNPDCIHGIVSQGGLTVTSSYHVSGACLPTASDEAHWANLTNMSCVGTLNTNYAADRILNYWIASDGRSFRVGPALVSGTFDNTGVSTIRWGVEQVQVITLSGTVAWSGSWAFVDRGNNANTTTFQGYQPGNASGGQIGLFIGSVLRQIQFVRGVEVYGGSVSSWSNTLTNAQGGTAYYMQPIGLACVQTGQNSSGKFGNLVDWWYGRTTVSAMDTYGTLNFVVVGSSDGIVWPWDGATTPITS